VAADFFIKQKGRRGDIRENRHVVDGF
jgi:hypothetical protein